MHHLLIPLLRLLSDGQFHSGTELAQQLGVSRATVCNVIKASDNYGVQIYKVQGRGYRLPARPDWLNSEQVIQQLHAAARRCVVHVVDCIDSTNTALMHAADTSPDRVCLVAEQQLAGRGRRGRTWLSMLGGSLTFSVRWRLSLGISALSGLSLAVGLAVKRALCACGAQGVQLKWPNDLLWQGRKVAGILIEVQGESHGPTVVVMGMGINMRIPPAARQHIDQPVADVVDIVGHAIARNILLAEILNHLTDVMTEFEQHGFVRLREEWLQAHAHAQQCLHVTLAHGGEFTGRAIGLTPLGALLLESESGEQVAIHSGDVQLARQVDGHAASD